MTRSLAARASACLPTVPRRTRNAGTHWGVHRLLVPALLSLFALAEPALAQEEGQSRGSYTLTYQYVREGGVNTNIGILEVGHSDTHAVLLDIEYSLNEKWQLFGSLPYITKRYKGDAPHDPSLLTEHEVDEPFIDDGAFHSFFQDFAFGARYSLPMRRVDVQPYVAVVEPSNDYPIFAHAAVGQHLRRLDVGARMTYLPPFSNFYYSFMLTHAFVEKVLGVNVDHWRFDGEIGYFVNPRLSVKGFFLTRKGNGLEFPDDFPPPRNDLHWYEHEGFLARQYVILGLGTDWSLNERNRLSLSVLRSAHAKFVHVIDYGVSVGVTRSF